MVLIAEVVKDEDRCSLSVRAMPSYFIVVIPCNTVIVKGEQSYLIPFFIVRTVFDHNISIVIQEFIAVGYNDPAFQVSKVIHSCTSVAHYGDRDLFFCSVRKIHITGIFCRFHKLKQVFGIKS